MKQKSKAKGGSGEIVTQFNNTIIIDAQEDGVFDKYGTLVLTCFLIWGRQLHDMYFISSVH